MRCSEHCPPAGTGVLAAAVVAVPVAVAVESVLLWLLVILAVADLALVAWLVAVLRAGPRARRPAPVHPRARSQAVEAATAPRAVEAAKPVVYRITDLQESSLKEGQ